MPIPGFTCGTRGCCASGSRHVPETSPQNPHFLADSDYVQIPSDPAVGISGVPGRYNLHKLGQEVPLQYMQVANALSQICSSRDSWQIWVCAYLEPTLKDTIHVGECFPGEGVNYLLC